MSGLADLFKVLFSSHGLLCGLAEFTYFESWVLVETFVSCPADL